MPLARRSLLVGAAALATTGCGVAQLNREGRGPAVEFADARGRQVRVNGTPERVVAYVRVAASLWDFGYRCAATYGRSRTEEGGPNNTAGNLDLNALPSLGEEFEQFDAERYVRLNPDLLINPTYDNKTLWGLPENVVRRIEGLAPTLAVRTDGASLRTFLRQYESLAGKLGADLRTRQLADAKRRFERTSARIKDLAGTKRGLRVAAVAAAPNNFYLVQPLAVPELLHLRELGIDLVAPKTIGPDQIFETHSWEEPEIGDADLLLYDNREGALLPAELNDYPTWRSLAPVRANQLLPFSPELPFSYQVLADYLSGLADGLASVNPLS